MGVTAARGPMQAVQEIWQVSRCLAAFALKVLWAGLRLLSWMTRYVRLFVDYLAQSMQLTGPAQPPPPPRQQVPEDRATAREVEDSSFEAFEALCQRTEESVTLCDDSSSEMPSSDAADRLTAGNSSGLFTLWFTVSDTWGQREDDETMDASNASNDWIVLGGSGATVGENPVAQSNPAEKEIHDRAGGEQEESRGNEQDIKAEPAHRQAAAPASRNCRSSSPRSVLKSRLQQMLPTGVDVGAFVDTSTEGQTNTGMVIRLEGPLAPEAWEAACRLALGCGESGICMSPCYDAMFRNLAPALVQPLEAQVVCALGHWCGRRARCSAGELGFEGGAFAGLEGLATNVAAVLRGEAPPGWNRLE